MFKTLFVVWVLIFSSTVKGNYNISEDYVSQVCSVNLVFLKKIIHHCIDNKLYIEVKDQSFSPSFKEKCKCVSKGIELFK